MTNTAQEIENATSNVRAAIDGMGPSNISKKQVSDLLSMISEKAGIDKTDLVKMIAG